MINNQANQEKLGRKLDKSLHKKSKRKPLHEESWDELCRRGANLAEQMEWLNLKKKQKQKYDEHHS